MVPPPHSLQQHPLCTRMLHCTQEGWLKANEVEAYKKKGFVGWEVGHLFENLAHLVQNRWTLLSKVEYFFSYTTWNWRWNKIPSFKNIRIEVGIKNASIRWNTYSILSARQSFQHVCTRFSFCLAYLAVVDTALVHDIISSNIFCSFFHKIFLIFSPITTIQITIYFFEVSIYGFV